MAARCARATIRNARGLHARASAKFAAVAGSFDAEITVACGEYRVSGLSIMGLMMLGAGVGDDIEIAADGPQAADAVATLLRLVEDRFGEKE
ncbi:MAG: HPr family phosphocarrier protein [Parvularculaceae bacterium]|nr:HPr family phosphocarrier protein [Parvularculaceae bacterium]